MNDKIKNICIKYLMNDADIEELEILENWLKQSKNKQLFANYLKINYAMDINYNPFDTEESINEVLEKIRKDRQKSRRQKLMVIFRYAAAAIFIGVLTTTYFLKDNFLDDQNKVTPKVTNQNTILPGTDKATLTLEDGTDIALVKGQTYQSQNANSNGEALIYEANQGKTNKVVYNNLTIPRGGEYFVKLSDGTKVWLNSETQLKFPVNFIEGQPREVQLVYGEAYFEVSPSTEHKGSKFKVYNQWQEVEVFGTEFNIKAYKDENSTYTTLVEGKVGVSTNGKVQNLSPSQQLSFNVETEQINVAVVDVYSEILWKEGIFSFEDKPLQEIMKVLSRWYDMEVVFENEAIKNEEFFGLLRKNQDIEKILATISEYGIVKEYEFKDKVLILK